MAVIIIVAEQVASQYLREIEQKLFDEHDKALRMEDIKQGTILTRFGEVNVKRRLYQDRDGHYLLSFEWTYSRCYL